MPLQLSEASTLDQLYKLLRNFIKVTLRQPKVALGLAKELFERHPFHPSSKGKGMPCKVNMWFEKDCRVSSKFLDHPSLLEKFEHTTSSCFHLGEASS